MTKFDANWVKSEEAKRKYMAENGLYSEAEEHASCGVDLWCPLMVSQAAKWCRLVLMR